jgi:hypothetical protein
VIITSTPVHPAANLTAIANIDFEVVDEKNSQQNFYRRKVLLGKAANENVIIPIYYFIYLSILKH